MSHTNSSATGGILCGAVPFGLDEDDEIIAGLDHGFLDGTLVANGQALNRFLHDYLKSLIACGGDIPLFPRWQPEPPNLPDYGKDWAAFGIVSRKADTYSAFVHNGPGDFDEQQRHEVMDILVSFYGPNADAFAELLREQIQVQQNREPLLLKAMGLVETGDLAVVPELTKERWLMRVDLMVVIRRQILRQLPVLSLEQLAGFQGGLQVEPPGGPVINVKLNFPPTP